MKSFLLGICFLLGSQLYAQDLSPAQTAKKLGRKIAKFCLYAKSPPIETPEEVAKRPLGTEVIMIGRVVNTLFDTKGIMNKSKNYFFIDIDRKYRDNLVVVKIADENVNKFSSLKILKGKTVIVRGIVLPFKPYDAERIYPNIELKEPSQLEILND